MRSSASRARRSRPASRPSSAEVASHDLTLSSLTVGELDCPRLVVFLPLVPPASKVKRLVHRAAKGFVKDKYRLVFLDPVSGSATPTGPDGNGYVVELPTKWMVDHAKHISDGLKVAKLACVAGRLAGLPLPDVVGMPPEVVSKAEMQALQSFELLTSASLAKGPDGVERATTKGAKVATGKSYKALRQIINSQCNDRELIYCGMQKVRANDGTIEFVAPESIDKFKAEGKACLVWNKIQEGDPALDA